VSFKGLHHPSPPLLSASLTGICIGCSVFHTDLVFIHKEKHERGSFAFEVFFWQVFGSRFHSCFCEKGGSRPLVYSYGI
jgi:hypothetical protein